MLDSAHLPRDWQLSFSCPDFDLGAMHSHCLGGLFVLRRQKNFKKGASLKGPQENNRC